MHPLSQEKLPDDILQKYEAEARKGYTITQAMLEIRYHRKRTPISKELVCFAGCVLWGVHGKWTPHVTDFCKIKENWEVHTQLRTGTRHEVHEYTYKVLFFLLFSVHEKFTIISFFWPFKTAISCNTS